MEIEDEDVVVHGTDLQKYLHSVGQTEFEVSDLNNVKKLGRPESYTKEPKYSRKTKRLTQNYKKDFGLCVTLIKIVIESHLMFKEDIVFIKEFVPSDHTDYPRFLTRRNSFSLAVLCFICGLLNVFFSEHFDVWTSVGILSLWFGLILMDIFYDIHKKRAMKNMIFKTIKSMEKSSQLIHKTSHFLQECNNLHGVYSSCNNSNSIKNVNVFKYLLMPELKTMLLTVIQDLVNNLVYSIAEIHSFFPLKNAVSDAVYLYLTDCKIDLHNTSLDNINKAKYMYFLLQSEFLKKSVLCLCPALWTPSSFSQMNRLVEAISKLEIVYSNLYDDLSEEYDVYSLFKNNNHEHNKFIDKNIDKNSDLKLKVYSIRQFLQNMMVHVRFMEDSTENFSKCNIDDLNNTLNVLAKEANGFSELISTLQIYILKSNYSNRENKSLLPDDTTEIIDCVDNEINEPVKNICEDELFFGISEELPKEEQNKCCDEEVFDKSNNHNLMLELKVALKDKEEEWKQRETKLLEKHPQLNDLSDGEECSEEKNQYVNKVRKVALDMPLNEQFSLRFPDKSIANEIAVVACKWNTAIESFGDDSDSDTSCDSAGS